MNILLISECSGRALGQTRRILDQFAERRGERTWQTPITQAGLQTLHRLLRKSARKNTAVACHWIRGLNHSELLWVVGDARRFNAQGAVPTHTTQRNVLRQGDENDWHSGEDISLLAQMAALLHDLGKASVAFQSRLQGGHAGRNLYRHEWVSLRLFAAFVGTDDDAGWLTRLASPDAQQDARWLDPAHFFRDGVDADTPPPFAHLPPLAAAIAWLVVTHHRLLTLPVDAQDDKAWFGKRSNTFNPAQLQPETLWPSIHAGWNDWHPGVAHASAEEVRAYWQMANDLPVQLPAWRARAAKLAQRLLALQSKPGKGDWLSNPYVMHLARLALMLADHHYSSLPAGDGRRLQLDEGCRLYANTDREGRLKQPLDEHLLGVARDTAMLCAHLPSFAAHLPGLSHKRLRKRTTDARFRWQDKAFDAAESLREQAATQGAFIVNMASTGRGKTLANARIMYALTRPQQEMRCTFAVGLRSLTLQTGCAFQRDLNLRDDEIAIRVGGTASRALFEYHQAHAERSGSASTQNLLDEDAAVFYEGNEARHPLLRMAMQDARIKALLSAPLLVCTIDHLTPATEAQRAGRQIAPMLRLMSSDLVLDEPDDFDLADIPALTRLVYWAGLLGSRVLLSSATLPPDLVAGLFQAYTEGRAHYQRNRGAPGHRIVDVPCLWVDEFTAETASCAGRDAFFSRHQGFVEKRIAALKVLPSKRRGELRPLSLTARKVPAMRAEFAEAVRETMLHAHHLHAQTDTASGKRVSFGLVRMANIDPLYDVALALFRRGAPENVRIHLCVYHSRFPLLLRSEIEKVLDRVLDRRGAHDPVLEQPDIRARLAQYPEQDHLFVVLASPVAEVGRDHDYDWAVVEPSSMRSLIQLAGRVCRHREGGVEAANVFIFSHNLRHFEHPGQVAYIRPGFEESAPSAGRKQAIRFKEHDLHQLMSPEQYQCIDASSRIHRPAEVQALQWHRRWVDLEHARMFLMLRDDKPEERNASLIWTTPLAHLTWALPQQQPFRAPGQPEQTLVFRPDEDETCLHAWRVQDDAKHFGHSLYTEADESLFPPIDLARDSGPGISPWMTPDMLDSLKELAEAQSLSLDEAAKRFTQVNVPVSSTGGWYWHPVLGFKQRQ